jgi:hypothetical protein
LIFGRPAAAGASVGTEVIFELVGKMKIGKLFFKANDLREEESTCTYVEDR